ncbi:TPA: hypothetical protein I4G64_02090 [Enterobacter cloacae]|nr:hypothetical protein [Enterobacter pasteurii]
MNSAQVSGDKIVADIGRDLWMSSQPGQNCRAAWFWERAAAAKDSPNGRLKG